MADGAIGFEYAINSYDPNGKEEFITYAYRAVEQKIRNSDLLFSMIRLSDKKKQLLRKIYVCQFDLEYELNREPTFDELIDRLNETRGSNQKEINPDRVTEILEYLEFSYLSLDYEADDGTAFSEYYGTFDEHYEEIENSTLQAGSTVDQYKEIENNDYLNAAMNQLDPEEQLIIGHFYGVTIDGHKYEKLKLAEISELLKKPIKVKSLSEKKSKIEKKLQEWHIQNG